MTLVTVSDFWTMSAERPMSLALAGGKIAVCVQILAAYQASPTSSTATTTPSQLLSGYPKLVTSWQL